MAEEKALDNVLRQASSVHITPVSSAFPLEDPEINLVFTDPADRESLRNALAVESVTGFVCMCWGDVNFDFSDAHGNDIARVVLHHGKQLYWKEWDGNADLADGALLLRWLEEHGMPRPLREFEAN